MTFRNRALLDLAHEAPCFLLPGQHECLGPPSEPAHSDMIRHGRGENHKSHDCFAPPGCHNAHLAFTRSNLGKEGYFQAWIEAMERYILWQWVSGKVRLADITQRPKESTMEAPMCKICEHRHYVRDPHQFGKDAPRPLGIGQSESKSEGARRRVEKSATSGASGTAKANTDTAKAPHRNTNASRGKAPKGGERTVRRSADSSGSRIAAAESKAGMRPSCPEAIDPVGGTPAKIPAATAARGRVNRAFKGKSAARRARARGKGK